MWYVVVFWYVVYYMLVVTVVLVSGHSHYPQTAACSREPNERRGRGPEGDGSAQQRLGSRAHPGGAGGRGEPHQRLAICGAAGRCQRAPAQEVAGGANADARDGGVGGGADLGRREACWLVVEEEVEDAVALS